MIILTSAIGSDSVQHALEELLKQNDPSPKRDHLMFLAVDFTRTILNLFIKVLTERCPIGANGGELQWPDVSFGRCKFVQCSTSDDPLASESVASDDICRLGTILASRVKSLMILQSPELENCLLRAPCLDMETLFIGINILQSSGSAVDYAMMGALLKQSINLNAFRLEKFEPGAMQVESIRGGARTTYHQGLTDLVMGVSHLLQNNQSQLRSLRLSKLELEDDHLMAITQILSVRSSRSNQDQSSHNDSNSFSRLEILDLTNNQIDAPAILDFAHHLPDMKFLRRVILSDNRWDKGPKAGECTTALIQGLLQNYSILFFHPIITDGLQETLIYHHFILNHAGQQILRTTDPVPLGLWAKILERAGTISYHGRDHSSDEKWRAYAVFFLLRKSPFIVTKGLPPVKLPKLYR